MLIQPYPSVWGLPPRTHLAQPASTSAAARAPPAGSPWCTCTLRVNSGRRTTCHPREGGGQEAQALGIGGEE